MRVGLALACMAALTLTACVEVEPRPESPAEHSASEVYRPPETPPALPPAPAGEKDRPPAASEIPPDLASIPDAVPEAVERSRYGNPDSYEVFGERYEILQDPTGFKESGHASWYGKKFHGRRTSSGEKYDMFQMTAAHKLLPIPSYARITNKDNGKSVVVRINDRGPFHPGRIVDLSYAAALKLDIINHGSAEVELEVVDAAGHSLAANRAPTAPPASEAKARVQAPAQSSAQSRTQTTATAIPTVGSSPRFLQAGVFSDAVNAATFRERLSVAGIKPLLMKSETRGGRWVYRVLIGPFGDTPSLEAMRVRMVANDTPTVPVID